MSALCDLLNRKKMRVWRLHCQLIKMWFNCRNCNISTLSCVMTAIKLRRSDVYFMALSLLS